MRNAVEALFRLERGRTPYDLRRVIRALVTLLRDPGQEEIRRAFTSWIKRLLRRKAGTSNIAEIERIKDLLEADTMLAERIESWFEEATRKGMQQGMLKGEANILSKLLKLRFGELPPEVVERLSQATQDEPEAWSEVILSAPTLATVFNTPRH